MFRFVSLLLLFASLLVQPAMLRKTLAGEIPWQVGYAKAMETAEKQGKTLLIYFHTPGKDRICEHFESAVLTDPQLRNKLQEHVCVRVPLDAKIKVQGNDVAVIESAAFEAMQGRPGVAILDFANRDAPYYGCVVSSFPFSQTAAYAVWQMRVILDLLPGPPKDRRRDYVDRCREIAAQKKALLAREKPAVKIKWLDNYSKARRMAKEQHKMLLVYFCDLCKDEPCNRFKAKTLDDPDVCDKLQDYVCVQIPLNAAIKIDGEDTVLLDHPSFKEMLGKPGIAIVDFANTGADHYSQVVSTFPITKKLSYTPKRMATILTLPPGTLTQRTLIYAVRIHPDKPSSSDGRIDPVLTGEAESHSRYQAKIRLQGHHQWDTRFQRINTRLPRGLTACEVCAESWPGENLVEAAIECVRCWRFSEGHWSAVRASHRVYGYDMKRGRNGIWYATGIFGRR